MYIRRLGLLRWRILLCGVKEGEGMFCRYVNGRDDRMGEAGLGCSRCTMFSSGRLSRWRFRVRENKKEGV